MDTQLRCRYTNTPLVLSVNLETEESPEGGYLGWNFAREVVAGEVEELEFSAVDERISRSDIRQCLELEEPGKIDRHCGALYRAVE
ncbi:hypothetical protein ACFX2I_013045 [Malus domestica]